MASTVGTDSGGVPPQQPEHARTGMAGLDVRALERDLTEPVAGEARFDVGNREATGRVAATASGPAGAIPDRRGRGGGSG
ncbi:hypothetical protein CLV30_1333 [Haloactinopolyspora alba]|uniref:Uncharacterized protein n=1 Tax=Haloactinopolyspora alba TaxID=648780 RepID=A0A2P8D3S3_9ACTN|nr:hypothetical protein [Haloactinopolyspora alba]PSK91870.1 hypothetical protein CLV30_1333 [Haloactinopolyspora alba]